MSIEKNKLSWVIGGEAGYGIMTAGNNFAKAMVLGGLNIYTHTEYPSLIRGGHNTFAVRVEGQEVNSPIGLFNLVVALDKKTVEEFKDRLMEKGGIIYDSDKVRLEQSELSEFSDIKLFPVPMTAIVNETEGAIRVMRNSVALGASMALLDYDFELLAEAIRGTYSKRKKNSQILDANVEIAKKGYDYVKENFKEDINVNIEKQEKSKKMILTGNHSISLGALKAGCKFVSSYPMTPATSIMEYYASKEESMDVVMEQADTEIEAINLALGASYGGVRAMTATSGGGLALMSETTSLIGMAEQPLVIVDAQRPGPSTGLPTRQGQEDLKFVLNIGHGEFPRIVIAPGDVEECFYETFNAFNLADKYQLPVFILTDKYQASSLVSMPKFDTSHLKIDRGQMLTDKEAENAEDYKRFKITETGVSPRSIPGQKAIYRSSSDEHDEYGNITEDPDNRNEMHEKRMRKLGSTLNEIPLPKLYGPEKADITIVAWGSTKGSILDAIKYLEAEGITANLLHFVYINPFHTPYVKKMLEEAKVVVDVEENQTGQLAAVIKEHTGFTIPHKVLKYDGRTTYPSDIYDRIKELYNG